MRRLWFPWEAGEKMRKQKQKTGNGRTMLRLLHGSWGYFTVCAASGLIFTVCELVISQIIRASVDSFIGNAPVKSAAVHAVSADEIIAHRLSTIRRADILLIVHDGKIVESDSHRELMAAKGAFWQIYTRQYREEQTRTIMESEEQKG